MRRLAEFEARSEEELYRDFSERGIPDALAEASPAGPNLPDMLVRTTPVLSPRWGQGAVTQPADWQHIFALGLADAVAAAVDIAGGREPPPGSLRRAHTPGERASSWLVSSYPLLGALAAGFRLIED